MCREKAETLALDGRVGSTLQERSFQWHWLQLELALLFARGLLGRHSQLFFLLSAETGHDAKLSGLVCDHFHVLTLSLLVFQLKPLEERA